MTDGGRLHKLPPSSLGCTTALHSAYLIRVKLVGTEIPANTNTNPLGSRIKTYFDMKNQYLKQN